MLKSFNRTLLFQMKKNKVEIINFCKTFSSDGLAGGAITISTDHRS